MIDIYAGFTPAQKGVKLTQLLSVYEQLVVGDKEITINDEGTGSVTYSRANLPKLEGLISGLQTSLGVSSGNRRAVRICYGG